MKCKECKTFKKADNCQQCFFDLKSHYWRFITILFELTEIAHISTLDKIKKVLREKKEEIRNFADPMQRDYKMITGERNEIEENNRILGVMPPAR